MILLSKDLIEEFRKTQKDKYPKVSEKQFKEICSGPWSYLKHLMVSGELHTLRLTYFGLFQVYPKRVKKLLQKLEKDYELNYVKKDEYDRIKILLTNFINESKSNT